MTRLLLLLVTALLQEISPWQNPDIPPTPPPELTGTQMGVVETIGVPPLGYEMDGDVKVFELTVQPVEGYLTDGEERYWEMIPEQYRYPDKMRDKLVQNIKLWGVNGSCPGPTIEVTQGDRLRVHVKNELPEPTSIHWHGIELPNVQDGAGGVTQYPIMPGETYTYEFTMYQSGTYLYHSGFNVTKQDDLGVGGILVAHPKEPEEKIDRDFAILLTQFDIRPGNDMPDAIGSAFGWFAMNGKVAPSIPTLIVHQGERVRLRFGNLSMMSHPIHIHGYSWEVVGTEGGPIPKTARWPGATVNIAPGQTRDVEFVAWNPGIWRLHCHRLHHILNQVADVPIGIMPHGGMYTYVYVIPSDPDGEWQHPNAEEITGGQ